MEFDMESCKGLKKAVEASLAELGKKKDLTPAEAKAALDGFELRDRCKCELGETEMKRDGYSQYSMHGGEIYATPRRYNITSYGMPDGRMSYGGPGWYDPSFNSMAMAYAPHPMMYYREDRGDYSRHSINDRAVACLEQMADVATSDYERQQVHRYIEMIRSAE